MLGRVLDSGVKAWLGIPFARPPVGERRWQEPQPNSWTGIHNADRKMSECIQVLRPQVSRQIRTTLDSEWIYALFLSRLEDPAAEHSYNFV